MSEVIKIKYHDPELIKIEKIGGKKSDWYDLRAGEDVHMAKGDYRLISLQISVQIPEGYEMIIAPRSSTFKHFGILMANSIGILDEEFNSDEDIVMFPALAMRDTEIHKNDRICQFRIQKHQPEIEFVEVETLGNESRGGFGSTGIQ